MLSEEEYKKLIDLMNSEKIKTTTKFIKNKIFNNKSVCSTSIVDLCFQVNKVGVNLNQITRKINETNHIDLTVLKQIHSINKTLDEYLKWVQK